MDCSGVKSIRMTRKHIIYDQQIRHKKAASPTPSMGLLPRGCELAPEGL